MRKSTPESVRVAARSGCWVTCFSALKLYGLWVPPMDIRPHLTTTWRRLETGRARASDLGKHRRLNRPVRGGLVVSPKDALIAAVKCGTPEQAFIVLESALKLGVATRDEVREILTHVSKKKARKIGVPGSRSDSGSESALAFRLRKLKLEFEQQVWIRDVGRVDILVGQSLVIELDSWQHHQADRKAYHRDRERDAVLIARGYTVVRLAYAHVFFDWQKYEALLRGYIKRRLHKRPVRAW